MSTTVRHAKKVSLRDRLAVGVLAGAVLSGTGYGLASLADTPTDNTSISAGARTAAVLARHHGDPGASASSIPVPSTGKIAKSLVSHSGDAAKTASTVTAKDALRLAEKQLGISEDAEGGGTKFQQWFMTSPESRPIIDRDSDGSASAYADAEWCDMFVSWVGSEAGVKGMGTDAYVPKHAEWFQEHGRFGHTPKPGAVVFFNFNGEHNIDNAEHVGLVMKDNHDGTITTIEGNTDNAVRIKHRDTSEVVGYGYPEYAK